MSRDPRVSAAGPGVRPGRWYRPQCRRCGRLADGVAPPGGAVTLCAACWRAHQARTVGLAAANVSPFRRLAGAPS